MKGILHRRLPHLPGGIQRYWSMGVGRREAPREIGKHGNYFRLKGRKTCFQGRHSQPTGGISFGGRWKLLGIPSQPCSPPPLLIPLGSLLGRRGLFGGLLALPFLPHILGEGGALRAGTVLQQERGRHFEHSGCGSNSDMKEWHEPPFLWPFLLAWSGRGSPLST